MFKGTKNPFLGIESSSNLSQKSGRLLEPYGRKLVFMEEYTPVLQRLVSGSGWLVCLKLKLSIQFCRKQEFLA